MLKRSPLLQVLLLAAAVVAVQLTVSGLGRGYYLVQMTMSAYTAMAVLALSLTMGYTGQISLGHAAFLAIGGYTSAVLTTLDLHLALERGWGLWLSRAGLVSVRPGMYGQDQAIGVAPWAAFAAALLLAALVAVVIGYPALRLRGHYLAMATLGFGLIVYRLVLGSTLTGAADGIAAVPPWTLLPGVTVCGATGQRVVNYYVAWATTGLFLLGLLNVMNSRVGRALGAIHGSERAANAMGVNTAAWKLGAFVVGAVATAAAGSLMTHYNASIGPSEAGVMKSVRFVAIVAAGGLANAWGVLVVGFVLTFLSLRGCFGTFDDAVFGAVLILIMSVCPEGPLRPLARLLARVLGRLWRTRAPAAATAPET